LPSSIEWQWRYSRISPVGRKARSALINAEFGVELAAGGKWVECVAARRYRTTCNWYGAFKPSAWRKRETWLLSEIKLHIEARVKRHQSEIRGDVETAACELAWLARRSV